MYIYLLSINLLAFLIYGLDKAKARHHRWRIPEWVLLLSAIVGGSVGAWLGMRLFHHKTQKPAFRLGVPVIFLIQSGVVLYLLISKQL